MPSLPSCPSWLGMPNPLQLGGPSDSRLPAANGNPVGSCELRYAQLVEMVVNVGG